MKFWKEQLSSPLCKMFMPWMYSRAKQICTNQFKIRASSKGLPDCNFILLYKSPKIIKLGKINSVKSKLIVIV